MAEQRYQAVLAVIADGRTVTEVTFAQDALDESVAYWRARSGMIPGGGDRQGEDEPGADLAVGNDEISIVGSGDVSGDRQP